MAFDSWGLLSAADALVMNEAASESHYARAVSTAYYAIFQHACCSAADLLLGGDDTELTNAKNHITRSISHRSLRARLGLAQKDSNGFDQRIVSFSNAFCTLQERRHDADYDVTIPFSRSDALTAIGDARNAMTAYDLVPEKHRKAFVVWAILDKPRR